MKNKVSEARRGDTETQRQLLECAGNGALGILSLCCMLYCDSFVVFGQMRLTAQRVIGGFSNTAVWAEGQFVRGLRRGDRPRSTTLAGAAGRGCG